MEARRARIEGDVDRAGVRRGEGAVGHAGLRVDAEGEPGVVLDDGREDRQVGGAVARDRDGADHGKGCEDRQLTESDRARGRPGEQRLGPGPVEGHHDRPVVARQGERGRLGAGGGGVEPHADRALVAGADDRVGAPVGHERELARVASADRRGTDVEVRGPGVAHRQDGRRGGAVGDRLVAQDQREARVERDDGGGGRRGAGSGEGDHVRRAGGVARDGDRGRVRDLRVGVERDVDRAVGGGRQRGAVAGVCGDGERGRVGAAEHDGAHVEGRRAGVLDRDALRGRRPEVRRLRAEREGRPGVEGGLGPGPAQDDRVWAARRVGREGEGRGLGARCRGVEGDVDRAGLGRGEVGVGARVRRQDEVAGVGALEHERLDRERRASVVGDRHRLRRRRRRSHRPRGCRSRPWPGRRRTRGSARCR